MKKTLLFLFIISLLYSASASAANTSVLVQGDSFFAGQTVQALVAMDRFEISKLALKDDAGNKMLVGFFRYAYGNNKYMVYFNLPSSMQPGNYSFGAYDRVMESGVLRDVNASSRFTVSLGESVFYIAPAVIKLDSMQSVFRIDLRHAYGAGADAAVSATDDALKPLRASITVSPGETKTLYVNYDYEKLKGDAVLKLSAGALLYEIPVISGKAAVDASEAQQNASGAGQQIKSALEAVGNISVLRHKVARDRTIAGRLKIKNAYSQPLHNITFASEGVPGVEINVSFISAIFPNETYTQYVWINRKKDAATGLYAGKIEIQSAEGAGLEIRLEIEFEDILQAQNQSPAAEQAVLLQNQTSQPAALGTEPDSTRINLTFNFSEIQRAGKEQKSRSLLIAAVLIAVVILLLALLAYRIRPRMKYRQMREYVKEVGVGEKNR